MDRITESLLAEFSREHGLADFAEDRRFEHFAAYVTIRRQYGESFDTGDVVVARGGDGGIDAIAFIVNGILVADADEFRAVVERAGSVSV